MFSSEGFTLVKQGYYFHTGEGLAGMLKLCVKVTIKDE